MARIASINTQQVIARSLLEVQGRLRDAQLQLATGRKAETFSGLGPDVRRAISARSLSSQWEAYGALVKTASITLEVYDTQLVDIDDIASKLRASIREIAAAGWSAPLQPIIEGAWGEFRRALNANYGGVAIFAGSRTDVSPVAASQFSDLAGKPLSEIFQNDEIKAKVRVAPNTDVSYGLTASEVATDLVQAFRDLADAGPIVGQPTQAQLVAVEGALSKLSSGIDKVRSINVSNGLNQATLERYEEKAVARRDLFDSVAGSVEDADLGQVATRISSYRVVLEASYSTIARLQNLSLANFLR